MELHMKTPEREKKIDKMSSAFEAARSLIAGVKIIIDSDGIEEDGIIKYPTVPVIVCSALAIEIQIKALLDHYKVSRPSGDGHDLKTLFNALPENLQQQLLAYQASYTDLTDE